MPYYEVECHSCQLKLGVPQRFVGKTVSCRKCKSKVRVPHKGLKIRTGKTFDCTIRHQTGLSDIKEDLDGIFHLQGGLFAIDYYYGITEDHLVKIPTKAISQVTYARPTKSTLSQKRVAEYIAAGFSIGVLASLYMAFQARDQGFYVWLVAPIICIPIAIAGFAAWGYLGAKLKLRGKKGDLLEFKLMNAEDNTIATFYTKPEQFDEAVEILREAGWNPQETDK